MRHFHLSVVVLPLLLAVTPGNAVAAEITVLAPGVVIAPLRKLAAEWTAKTGEQIDIRGGNVQSVSAAAAGAAPADLVLLPDTSLDRLREWIRPESRRRVGRVLFGLVVKRGPIHPCIATREQFLRAVRDAGELAFGDPANGSLSGRMVEEMLRRPAFAGVRPRPVQGMIGEAIVRGDAALGAGAVSEILMTPGAELVGRIPDGFGIHIDIGGAVLVRAADSASAAAFLRYITAPTAAKLWTAGGIARPDRVTAHRCQKP